MSTALPSFSVFDPSKRRIWFGAGGLASFLWRQLKGQADAVVDNDEKKWGTLFHGLTIYPPKDLLQRVCPETRIVIASSYEGEIQRQLLDWGWRKEQWTLARDLWRQAAAKERHRKLAPFWNCHQGQTAYLIGNGPSLTVADLDLLRGRLSFAANKITLAFPDTTWRPTYYVVVDHLVASQNVELIAQVEGPKFIVDTAMQWLGHLRDTVWLPEHTFDPCHSDGEEGFAKDVREGVYSGWSVLYTMMQLSYFMGIRTLILLGVDFSFQVKHATEDLFSTANQTLAHQGERNHFHPAYRKEGERWNSPALDLQKVAFAKAAAVFAAAGGQILNASRATALEVFPRISLEAALFREGTR